MTNDELKTALMAIGISQVALARLVNVTPRAVSLWMTGDRTIPGPAEAYLRLLQSLPASRLQVELSRLKDRKTEMREGIYAVDYQSVVGNTLGTGNGVLILENGRTYGADPWGGRYDGEYLYNERTGCADLALKLTFAPNSPAVFGVSHPYEWSIDVTTSLNPKMDSGRLNIVTPIGPRIDVEYRYMRALPDV